MKSKESEAKPTQSESLNKVPETESTVSLTKQNESESCSKTPETESNVKMEQSESDSDADDALDLFVNDDELLTDDEQIEEDLNKKEAEVKDNKVVESDIGADDEEEPKVIKKKKRSSKNSSLQQVNYAYYNSY